MECCCIAKNDEDCLVRKQAIRKITDKQALTNIFEKETEEQCYEEALYKIKDDESILSNLLQKVSNKKQILILNFIKKEREVVEYINNQKDDYPT